MTAQPRCYRIRLFRKNREVGYGDEHLAVVLDLNPGPGLWATKGELNGLVQALAWADGARGEDTLNYRLAVHDWDTDRLIMHWHATNWNLEQP